MAVQVELCCLESFPSDRSPSDVSAITPHSESLFHHDANPPTVLFTPNRPQFCDRTAILSRVHPTTAEEVASSGGRGFSTADSEPGLRVCLFTSKFFSQHYRLQCRSGGGIVRPSEPVDSDRVVLGARSRQSLRWAGGEQFTGGSSELCRLGQEPSARQGDPLSSPHHPSFGEDTEQVQQHLSELSVSECSPVRQGRITTNTSSVLTHYWDSAEPPGPSLPCRSLRSCVSDFAHYADSLGGARSLLDGRRCVGSGSPEVLQALECRLDVRVVDTQRWRGVKGKQGASSDTDSCVFMSKQSLSRSGSFNHEWVRLSRPAGSHRGPLEEADVGVCPRRERSVSAVVVDSMESPESKTLEDVGFISATSWFNMTEGEMVPLKNFSSRMKRWRPADLKQRSDSFCRSASPPFTTELHIQPVVSPRHIDLSRIDNSSAEHFSTPRVVSQGDISTIPAKNHPDSSENNAEGIHRCTVLYFKVQKVLRSAAEGEGAHSADKTHTSLYLGVLTNSRVPCCCVEGKSSWSSSSPSGLSKTIDLLSDLISPHSQHRDSSSGCTVFLHGPAGSGKTTVVRAASCRSNLHSSKVDCVTSCADTPAAAEAKSSSVFQRAEAQQPCVSLLRNSHLSFRAGGAAEDDSRVQAASCSLLDSAPASVFVVATVCRARNLSSGVMGAFVHQVEMESPTEQQRLAMLVGSSREVHSGRDVDSERSSKLTAGFVSGDLSTSSTEAGRAACRRSIHTCGGRPQEDLCSSGVTITNQDFGRALETLQDAQSKAIGAPKIPNVRWEDIGGLEHVKKEISDTVQLPSQRPELSSLGSNRTGVSSYGPPGTGKTSLAKAVATECSMTFLSVKGPELINMYVGQSEENIREVFHRAHSAAPCVVFFDESDSSAPNRGRSGDSGGVMDRVVSQSSAELDSSQSSAGVFVIGATNRPDSSDQSSLRPGRFDKSVYVGINEDRISQSQVLQAILRKFQSEPDVNLQDIVDQCPAHMTGADSYALCSDAMTAAVKRKICQINDGLDSEDSPVLLSVEDFSSASKTFKPSISEKESSRYRNLHQELSIK